jgi:hypothetical protein
MDTIFNLLVIAFAGLIAYWWANQGLFSALIHLVCVVVAGALAFATWEPVAQILIGVPALQPYARGIALLLPFAVYLFLARFAGDKIAPDNVNFPHPVNLTLGGAAGLGAGILTVGIAIIGMGHMHAARDLLGVTGVARTGNAKGQPDFSQSPLWVPAHDIAAGFYSMLSTGAMAPTLTSATLASTHPLLAEKSLGLHRDTYTRNGRLARTTAAPGSISITKAILVPAFEADGKASFPAYVVDLHLEPGATTEGQGFAVSASQVPLVGTVRSARTGAGSGVSFPRYWSQPNAGGGRSVFPFDDVSHFMSAPPGTTTLDVTLVYPAEAFGSGEPPRFLEAMGNRLPFPQIAQESTMGDAIAMVLGNAGGAVSIPEGTPMANADDLKLNDSIMPANADLNNIGSMEVKDTNYMFEGRGEYEQGGFRGNKSVVVKGIWSPPGTRVVRLDISRGRASIDFWGDRSPVRGEVGESANLALVDDLGRLYFPIGYIHAMAGGDRMVEISLARAGTYSEIGKFPNLSSSGADQLYAIFTPAIGRKIVGIKLGDRWVARADLDVTAPG